MSFAPTPAEPFFEALYKGGYIPDLNWKNTHPQTTAYKYKFHCQNCKNYGFHIFNIIVENGVHKLYPTEIRLFLQLHDIKLD